MVIGLLMVAWTASAQPAERTWRLGGAVGVPLWVENPDYSGGTPLQLLVLRPVSRAAELDVAVHAIRGVRTEWHRGVTRHNLTALLLGMRVHGSNDGRLTPYARLALGAMGIDTVESWYDPSGGGHAYQARETTRTLAGLAGVGLGIRLGDGRSTVLLGFDVLAPNSRHVPTVASLSLGLLARL
jgi:hypothetical protein